MSADFRKCKVADCERDARRSAGGKVGFCSMHYSRWRTHGDPSVVAAPPSPAKDWLLANRDYGGDECLVWPFHIGADGYGRAHRFGNGTLTTASNIMCELAHGPAPSRKHECAHSCGRGNAGCTNPRHLYWATPNRNHADKIVHGTTNRGERQGASRLTEADVIAIRQRAASETQTALAAAFGVDQSHISKIVSGERWDWMP